MSELNEDLSHELVCLCQKLHPKMEKTTEFLFAMVSSTTKLKHLSQTACTALSAEQLNVERNKPTVCPPNLTVTVWWSRSTACMKAAVQTGGKRGLKCFLHCWWLSSVRRIMGGEGGTWDFQKQMTFQLQFFHNIAFKQANTKVFWTFWIEILWPANFLSV